MAELNAAPTSAQPWMAGAGLEPNATAPMATPAPAPEINGNATAGLSGTAPNVGNAAMEAPAKPHESVARHIMEALGSSNGRPMDWARGVLAGGLAAAANVGKVPEGAGFLTGAAKGAQGIQQQKQLEIENQQKQQEMQLKQKADERAEKELQIHMEDTKVQRAMWTAQTAASIQTSQQNAARFPTLEKEDQLRIQELQTKIHDSERDQLAVLSAAGVNIADLEHITDSKDLTEAHAKQAGSGDIFPVQNGEKHDAGEDGAGVHLVPGDVWEKPITKPVTITTGYEVDKNGKTTPKTVTAQAGTKVGTLLAIAKGAQSDLATKQKNIMDQATINQKNAEAFKATEEGKKAASEAKATDLFSGGGAAGGPSTQNIDPKTGADEGYLKSLPPNLSAEVRAMGEGRVEINARMFQSKQGQQLGAALTRAYPGFDQSKAQSYFKMRQDFTSGKTATAINSYNTGIAHLGTMWDHVSGTNSVQLNNPFSDVHRQLDLDKQLVSTELAKAVSNGSMTEGEKNEILKSIAGATVSSYQTRIREAVTLLHGKQEAYQEQWNNGAPPGAVSQVHIISPQSEQTISRVNGQQQQQPQPQGHPHPVGEVKEYLGGKYVFDGKQYVLQQSEGKEK